MVTYVPMIGPTKVGKSDKPFVLGYARVGGLEIGNEVEDVT